MGLWISDALNIIKQKKDMFFYFIISVVSIFIGGLIYLLFRPANLIMFVWIDHLGLSESLEDKRIKSKIILEYIPEWFIYSAPNAFWVFSFGMLMVSIWGIEKKLKIVFWSSTILLIGIFSEILQYFKLIPGVFDVLDIVFYTLGFLFLLLLLRNANEI